MSDALSGSVSFMALARAAWPFVTEYLRSIDRRVAIALVSAASPDGKHVTITQPQGETFVSPYLLFPTSSGGQRVDFFAVPPLHRTVNVTYYPSYRDDARHIYIASPFVLVQIREENGAALYRGATVSGRPIRGGGMRISFVLGTFPVVALSAAPATLPYAVGLLMLASGLAGYVWTALRPGASSGR